MGTTTTSRQFRLPQWPLPAHRVLLQWDKCGQMREVYEGQAMFPNGTYVEVEIKAVKTAKVVLE